MKQRVATMPIAALADPVMLDRMSGNATGIVADWACGQTATYGFTAKRSARHLGRPST